MVVQFEENTILPGRSSDSPTSGLIGLLLKAGVENKRQANLVLIAITVVCIVLTVLLGMRALRGTPTLSSTELIKQARSLPPLPTQ